MAIQREKAVNSYGQESFNLKYKRKFLDRRKWSFRTIFILTLYSVLFTGSRSLRGEALNKQRAKKQGNGMVIF